MNSLLPNTSCPDYRPPLFDLSLLEGAERLWSLLLKRRYLLPKLGEPLAYRGSGERNLGCGIEFLDDGARRVLWHPQAMPNRNMKFRQSRLIDCRDIRRRSQASL